jgi:hypothetical protein
MSQIIRNISRGLAAFSVLLLLYEVVYQWIVNVQFKIRTGAEMWPAPASGPLKALMSSKLWDSIAHLPAPAIPAIGAVFLYIVFRILATLDSKGKSGRV